MTHYKVLIILAAITMVGLAIGAHAADIATTNNTATEKPPLLNKHDKKMKMGEPMATRMMKKGMMNGDVKSAADKRAKEMQPMMEQEEKSMPQDKDKAKP